MKDESVPKNIKQSDAYIQGTAIGDMIVSQSLMQQQNNLHVEIAKQSGLMNKNLTAME